MYFKETKHKIHAKFIDIENSASISEVLILSDALPSYGDTLTLNDKNYQVISTSDKQQVIRKNNENSWIADGYSTTIFVSESVVAVSFWVTIKQLIGLK